jgi:Zn ribbon nucleic-acid-binding protein
MPKKPSRKTIVNNLDKVFSEYIRRRYAKNDIAECITCGKKDHWKKQQAGHFMSRKHYATRWDEDNVEVQCMACNVYRYGEQYLFAKHLGQDKADELLAKSRTMVKLKDWELQDMIEIYKKKLLELEQ